MRRPSLLVEEKGAEPGAWRWWVFPLGVWAVWRVAHLVLLQVFGGGAYGGVFNSDGGWYISILRHGYVVTDHSYATETNAAFMPGLVWITEPFSLVFGDIGAGIIVATLLGAVAFVAVFAAARSFSDERAARTTVIALALWPPSIFFWQYYSESLFVAATAIGFWGDRNDKPAVAGVGVFLAAASRTIGMTFGPFLAVAALIRRRKLDGRPLLYVAASAAAVILVMIQQRLQVQEALAFVRAQKAWGRELANPWTSMWETARDIKHWIDQPMNLLLNMVAVVIVLALVLVVLERARRGRFPWEPAVWSAAAWAMPLLTKVVTSQARFGVGAWPAFTAVHGVRSRWGRAALGVAAASCVAVTAVLSYRVAHLRFVG